ncbi:MAG: DNA photolyase [Desulfomonile tiedjei]|uniref:DNA photolyase n=1 Tax=Desulfomonile tiedjei TaxID=2358 RepID=A0A9D6Z4H4_9BACT|nr:DNA photolyase [Desulfomonile tiedjei]
MKFPIEQVWVDDEVRDEPLTREILRKLPAARILGKNEIEDQCRAMEMDRDPFNRGKRTLRLTKNKGAFVKPCPGTPEYICCGLEILNIGQGCPMDCRYCALQVYFNRPILEVFVNTGDLFSDLERHLINDPRGVHRICTGEFTDSLALDPLTGLAGKLAEFFSRSTNASLEIKTKTDFVDPLLEVDPHGRVVIAFSVNSREITRKDEIRAAPVAKRLAAAARAEKRGYRIAFHFDPIIPVPGWEEAYSSVINEIFTTVDPSSISWISMGVLRFVPALKEIAAARFGRIPYFHDGFIRGLDGKSRLHVDRRINIYKYMIDKIRRRAREARIYLCMESPHVWRECLGISMDSDDDLTSYLDSAILPYTYGL